MKTTLTTIQSYFIPVVVDRRKGAITDTLEVRLYNGRYTLDAGSVNYSFGGLHKVFEKAFESLCLESHNFKKVLILGMGAGSIMSILSKTYRITCPVTAVEKDFIVIDLGNQYFNMDQYNNLKLINCDAYEFVRNSSEVFDLILIDLFVEDQVPEIFGSESFLSSLRRIAGMNSIIVYNRLTDTPSQKQETEILYQRFANLFPGTYKLRLVDLHTENTLIISNTAQEHYVSPVGGNVYYKATLNVAGVGR